MAESIERARVRLRAILPGWNMPSRDSLLLLCVVATLLLGWFLRLASWGSNTLHPDEALYAYWAKLIASGRDPALLSVPVDKPPLYVYLLAAVFRYLGPTVTLARVPSLAASLLSLPILFLLARKLYGRSVALLALLLYAASPFAIAFAATGFTDSLLVLWGLAACLTAVRQEWLATGFFLGLAVATKQQGLLFIPLSVSLGWVASRQTRERQQRWYPLLTIDGLLPAPLAAVSVTRSPGLRTKGAARTALVKLLAGFLPLLVIVTWWDSLRWRVWPSFWERSWIAYGGLHLVTWQELGERGRAWLELVAYLVASPWLTLAGVFGICLLLYTTLVSRRHLTPAARTDLIVMGYGVGFLALHALVSFQTWDRYLLPLAPLAALLLARGATQPIFR